MKKQMIISLLIAGVCIYFAFRGISFGAVYDNIRHAKWSWIVVALIMYTGGYVLRSYRWAILIRPVKALSARELMSPMIIGFFANNVLPLRTGELVRAHITGRKFKISRTASLATILLERLFDLVAFLSTFVFSALTFPFPPKMKLAAGIMAGLCLCVMAGIFLMVLKQHWFEAIIRALPLPSLLKDKSLEAVENFAHGISGVLRLEFIIGAMLLSLVVWTIEGTFLFLFALALSIPISWPQSFFLLFFIGLAVTLPQAPGYVGSIEFAGKTALGFLHIPQNQGLAMILTLHAVQFMFITALGFWALSKEGLSFRQLKATAESESAAPAVDAAI